MVIPESQIRALIRLLSDEDDRIVRTISGQLIIIGPPAVPLLQEAEIEQPEMADRIASVLEEIRWGKLEEELVELAAQPDQTMSLETGAFLIARHAYPALDVAQYLSQLDRMAQEVRARIGLRSSGEETVNALNRYLFVEQGFKGNTKNYYETDNSYLNRVIDRRAVGRMRAAAGVGGGVVVGDPQRHLVGQAADPGRLGRAQVARRMGQDRAMALQHGPFAGIDHFQVGAFGQRVRGAGQGALEGFDGVLRDFGHDGPSLKHPPLPAKAGIGARKTTERGAPGSVKETVTTTPDWKSTC